jgi:cytochrome P450
VVRNSPNALSFNTAEALKDIYADRHANVIKAGWAESAANINQPPSTQAETDRTVHAAKRKVLANAFSEQSLKSAEDFMLTQIRKWCDLMGEQPQDTNANEGWSKEKNMSLWSNLLTLDVLGELCFGESFSSLDQGHQDISVLLMRSVKLTQNVRCPNPFPT